MKQLTFGTEPQDLALFSDLYQVFRLGETYVPGKFRVAVKIEDALDAISDPVRVAEGITTRRLRVEGGELLLENDQYDTLKQIVKVVCEHGVNALSSAQREPVPCRPLDARRALRLTEFLEGAKDVPVVAAVPKPEERD
jgi:hypothetical protein